MLTNVRLILKVWLYLQKNPNKESHNKSPHGVDIDLTLSRQIDI